MKRDRLLAIVTGNSILYGLVAYEVLVIAAANLVGAIGRPPIVTYALVLGGIAAIAVLGTRSLVRHKVLPGGAIAAALLLATVAILLLANPVPKPMFIAMILLYAAAAVAFLTRPLEI